MTIFDYAVLAILVLSILLSVVRGVVRELLSLAGWIIAVAPPPSAVAKSDAAAKRNDEVPAGGQPANRSARPN